MALFKNDPSDISLLRKEVEVLGDFIDQERVDREGSVEELRLELDALKDALTEAIPGFRDRFEAARSARLNPAPAAEQSTRDEDKSERPLTTLEKEERALGAGE